MRIAAIGTISAFQLRATHVSFWRILLKKSADKPLISVTMRNEFSGYLKLRKWIYDILLTEPFLSKSISSEVHEKLPSGAFQQYRRTGDVTPRKPRPLSGDGQDGLNGRNEGARRSLHTSRIWLKEIPFRRLPLERIRTSGRPAKNLSV